MIRSRRITFSTPAPLSDHFPETRGVKQVLLQAITDTYYGGNDIQLFELSAGSTITLLVNNLQNLWIRTGQVNVMVIL